MKVNLNYGTIVDDQLQYAPAVITTSKIQIINPREEDYFRHGYKKIVQVGNGWESFIEKDSEIVIY